MTPIVSEDIERYAESHTEPVDPLFEELREETQRTMDQPQMQVGRVEGTFLRMLVSSPGARRALEIGMFTGYSGLMIAAGLPDDGELVTCDVDPKAEAIARRYFARSPHGRKIRIRMGPALETIRELSGPLDFVFIDADKANYSNYYDAVLPLLRAGRPDRGRQRPLERQGARPEGAERSRDRRVQRPGRERPARREGPADGARRDPARAEEIGGL